MTRSNWACNYEFDNHRDIVGLFVSATATARLLLFRAVASLRTEVLSVAHRNALSGCARASVRVYIAVYPVSTEISSDGGDVRDRREQSNPI